MSQTRQSEIATSLKDYEKVNKATTENLSALAEFEKSVANKLVVTINATINSYYKDKKKSPGSASRLILEKYFTNPEGTDSLINYQLKQNISEYSFLKLFNFAIRFCEELIEASEKDTFSLSRVNRLASTIMKKLLPIAIEKIELWQSHLDTAKSMIEDLRKVHVRTLDASEAESSEKDSKITALNESITMLKAQLALVEKENKTQKEEIATLKNSLSLLNQAQQAMQEKYTALEEINNTLEQEKNSIAVELKNANLVKQQLIEEKNGQQIEISNLTQKVEAAEGKYETLKAAQEKLEQEKNSIAAAFEKTISVNQELLEEKNRQQTEISNLTQKVTDTEAQYKNLEVAQEKLLETEKEKNKNITALFSDNFTLQSRLTTLSEKNTSLGTRVAELKKQVADTEITNQELNTKIQSQGQEISTLQDEKTSLNIELQEAHTLNNDFKELMTNITKPLREACAKYKEHLLDDITKSITALNIIDTEEKNGLLNYVSSLKNINQRADLSKEFKEIDSNLRDNNSPHKNSLCLGIKKYAIICKAENILKNAKTPQDIKYFTACITDNANTLNQKRDNAFEIFLKRIHLNRTAEFLRKTRQSVGDFFGLHSQGQRMQSQTKNPPFSLYGSDENPRIKTHN